jgi:pimeloyl-ACP methyl ester carboxylesterase
MTTSTTTTSTSTRTHGPRIDHSGIDDLGHGDPALLLIPGWCGDRTVFAPLAERLARQRRAVVTDLRGHGGNADQSGDFNTARQVQDLVDLIEERRTERLVPVALSHAGWLAVELRRRLGSDRVPGVVLLDWMVLGTPPGFDDALAGLQSPDVWQEVRGGLFGMWTSGVETEAVLDYVASMSRYGFDHWSRAGREISASFASEGTPLAALQAMEPPCPTLHLYAQPADDDYLTAQEQAATEHPWFRVARLDANSHFPMLEVPEEMAEHIEEFASSLG